ncbi:4-hydroxy-tetrahydrodipicolinate reductase [Commensalibacter communis]|uniref:4-hydroxy-tetrahydrodipicolinate reductase n=1 Tax=Commensalibacter communis TaxID=2972786 RepID=UPI0022FF942C|nr:4-hydroxy-tetrahydrodipicolinate reductase [Commensalibacter communis]CAI3936665.1 4-hydroxy-tetrahydrodipicolinate reductase (DapB) (PDB:1ARZ) (PUBMED:29684280) [Commensalibacter communis]CAI3941561.1 4-hydroxy-tetrahydrodipicolinate reductase (DapB) (PDB:1ARZ) (PUBMED:29684280) [Commensalibacter communis]
MTSSPLRIGIAGITGRVGRLLVEEVQQQENAVLSGGTALSKDINNLSDTVPVFDNIDALIQVSDVIIDFTNAAITGTHAKAFKNSHVAWVLGTTGISEETQRLIQEAASTVPVIQAANFSPGVTLMLRLAGELAKALPATHYDAEIIETHHRQKVDAPSGTALAIGESIAKARNVQLKDVKESGRDGVTGARKEGAIGFAALRGGQIVGEHSAIFLSDVEEISLTHKAFDRRIFAKGAVRSALWSPGKPAGLYGMTHVLGLDPVQ